MQPKETVAIIGAGLMGHGIAQAFATAGHRTVITDTNAGVLGAALSHITGNLRLMGIEAGAVLNHLVLQGDLQKAVCEADLIIEAAPEKLDLKQNIFACVAAVAPKSAILASNTSVIPITDIGAKLDPEVRSRLIGTHWWNPPHLIPLIEVVKTEFTSDEVFEKTYQILAGIGKRPVKVFKDIPGFIGNRLQHALWREAIYLVNNNVCDAETIDTVVKQSFGMRLPVLGPMENIDLVGLELVRAIHQIIFPDLSASKIASPLLERLIAEGLTGMKVGQGMRQWTPEAADEVRQKLATHLINAVESAA